MSSLVNAGQMAAVALVFALLAGLLWAAQRTGVARWREGRSRTDRRLEVLERLALGPQQSLHLVRCDGRLLLVSTTAANSTLMFLPDSSDPPNKGKDAHVPD